MPREGICADLAEAIGNTPLVYLNQIPKDAKAKIAVKLEYMNPACSVKDRIGMSMIEEAEKQGLITPGKSVLVEATAGNTGIALAFYARIKGYKLIIVLPEAMSMERRALSKAYGAELRVFPHNNNIVLGPKGMIGEKLVKYTEDLAAEIPNSYVLAQFANDANWKAHYNTTGPEIWRQTDGKVDIFCFGAGTGGTITGTGRFLRKRKPELGIYVVEPFESSVISGLPAGQHRIAGMGAGFVPPVMDMSLFNGIIRVSSDEAIEMARRLAAEEGILGGISSGANVHAALELANRPENVGKLIITCICSFGERYLSSELYSHIKDEVEKLEGMPLEKGVQVAKRYVEGN